jgi:F-type H+-transporting ATPase subunit c
LFPFDFERMGDFMKNLQRLALVLMFLLVFVTPAFAQGTGSTSYTLSGAAVGAGIGAAFTIVGAGYGFGKIGSAALEGMARQPEAAGKIQTAMIVIAALLEGATFFALIICIQLVGQAKF